LRGLREYTLSTQQDAKGRCRSQLQLTTSNPIVVGSSPARLM
jgi:hypothetical protein